MSKLWHSHLTGRSMTPHPPPVIAPRHAATFVVLRFHSSKEKLGAHFTTLLFQIFYVFKTA
jgi:hypothetical protein